MLRRMDRPMSNEAPWQVGQAVHEGRGVNSVARQILTSRRNLYFVSQGTVRNAAPKLTKRSLTAHYGRLCLRLKGSRGH
jgi:hypothetical protein